jgi:hypothetical protein
MLTSELRSIDHGVIPTAPSASSRLPNLTYPWGQLAIRRMPLASKARSTPQTSTIVPPTTANRILQRELCKDSAVNTSTLRSMVTEQERSGQITSYQNRTD